MIQQKLFIWILQILCMTMLSVMSISSWSDEKVVLYIPPINEVMASDPASSPMDFDTSSPVWKSYLNNLRNKIEQTQATYPRDELTHERLYGRVVLVLIVRPDGSLIDVYPTIKSINENSVLAESAVKRVQLAAPFPPPPSKITKDQKSVRLNYVFDFIKNQ